MCYSLHDSSVGVAAGQFADALEIALHFDRRGVPSDVDVYQTAARRPPIPFHREGSIARTRQLLDETLRAGSIRERGHLDCVATARCGHRVGSRCTAVALQRLGDGRIGNRHRVRRLGRHAGRTRWQQRRFDARLHGLRVQIPRNSTERHREREDRRGDSGHPRPLRDRTGGRGWLFRGLIGLRGELCQVLQRGFGRRADEGKRFRRPELYRRFKDRLAGGARSDGWLVSCGIVNPRGRAQPEIVDRFPDEVRVDSQAPRRIGAFERAIADAVDQPRHA